MKNKNIANDINRWLCLDFVLGYEIHLSSNDCNCDTCKKLEGKYPKIFKWEGWSKNCTCYITPVLQDQDEFDKQELEELKSAINGSTFINKSNENSIKYLPLNFILWYLNNVESMLKSDKYPDFVIYNIDLIRESFEYYKKKQKDEKNKD